MKIQKRYGVFETNSSSTHTLCIPREKPENIELPKVVFVQRGCFDRSPEDITSINAKFSYIFELVRDFDNWEKSIETLKQTGTERSRRKVVERSFTGTYMDRFKELLASWGVEAVFDDREERGRNSFMGYCGVDHSFTWYQNGVLAEMFEKPDLLYNFLFAPNSLIQTGESCNRDDFRESNDEFIVFEKYD